MKPKKVVYRYKKKSEFWFEHIAKYVNDVPVAIMVFSDPDALGPTSHTKWEKLDDDWVPPAKRYTKVLTKKELFLMLL